MNIFNTAKKFVEQHPKSKFFLSWLYNTFSSNQIKIRGKNNIIKKSGNFLKKCKIIVIGNNNTIDFGDTSYLLNTKITIKGNNNKVQIGSKVYINNGDIYLEDSENNLYIGDKTIVAGATHFALTEGKKINIGKDCLFSNNIVLRTGDSHSILNEKGERINYGKNINLKDHIWITQNVTILKGAEIAENSIIGTGSIVTKSFNEKNVLITGNPAKIVKENINWCHKRI